MTDDLDAMPERQALGKISEAKHRAAVQKLRAQWAQDGFDPRAHLASIHAAGDSMVLINFRDRERSNPDRTVAWLVDYDIIEIANAIWYAAEREKRMARTDGQPGQTSP